MTGRNEKVHTQMHTTTPVPITSNHIKPTHQDVAEGLAVAREVKDEVLLLHHHRADALQPGLYPTTTMP